MENTKYTQILEYLKMFLMMFECIAFILAILAGITGFFDDTIVNYISIIAGISKLSKTSKPIVQGISLSLIVVTNTVKSNRNIKWLY